LRESSKRVSIGELIDPVSSKSYRRVNTKRREKRLPAFSYFLRPLRDLRRAGTEGKTLWFERARLGCERDPWGCARTPILSPKNSQTLAQRGPDELTAPYRSDPERDLELVPPRGSSRRATACAGFNSAQPDYRHCSVSLVCCVAVVGAKGLRTLPRSGVFSRHFNTSVDVLSALYTLTQTYACVSVLRALSFSACARRTM
jgi:hypothetical protein